MTDIDPRFIEMAKELLPCYSGCDRYPDPRHVGNCPATYRQELALALQQQWQAGCADRAKLEAERDILRSKLLKYESL